MSETVRNKYERLFEIHLLHHYWLDEGSTVFDLIPSQTKRDDRLLSYDMRTFLSMAPAAGSAKILKGSNGVYKNTALGCIVGVPINAILPEDTNFEFIVTVKNPTFHNYTALTLRPHKITELYYQPEKKTYRYKENVPVLTNLKGASRGTGSGKTLFLSSEIPALTPGDQVESLVLSGGALLQLTSDQPDAAAQELASDAATLPVFVHQNDVPVIEPPAGLVGAPERGILLSKDIPDNVFALIRITMKRADDEAFSCIGSDGKAKTTCPVFQIRFKNRSTIWKYKDKSAGDAVSFESHPLPLTHYGNAGTKQKPSEGVITAEKDEGRITGLFSEIYV